VLAHAALHTRLPGRKNSADGRHQWAGDHWFGDYHKEDPMRRPLTACAGTVPLMLGAGAAAAAPARRAGRRARQPPKVNSIHVTRQAAGSPRPGQQADPGEDEIMAEPTLYERLGGIFAIAAVVDNFSDRLLKNPTIVQANPELRQWHTVTYPGRLPGLKWLRTLWLASLAGGPFQYTGRELRDAHFDLKIAPEVFDEVAAELAHTLDDFDVPEREKGEVLAGFAGEKGEVTAGSQPGAVNWRRWR
jgi:hemoglobin